MAYFKLPISGNAISVADIYKVLDVPPRATGYDLGYICCNGHGKTNIWARYKPEAIGGSGPISDDQRKTNNYGLRPTNGLGTGYTPDMTGINKLVKITWAYTPPSATQWHRVSDWNGYEAQAGTPIGAVRYIDFPLSQSSITIDMAPQSITTENSLTLADFSYCKDMYLCVVVWTENPSTGAQTFLNYVTAADAIGDTSSYDRTEVTITRSELSGITSTYEIHYAVCFSTTRKTALSATLLTTTLYPVVTNKSVTNLINMSTSAPFSFTVTGISPSASVLPISDSLDYYGEFTDTDDGEITVNALGVGGYSGTIAIFGYFSTTSTTTLVVTGTPIRGTMQPTITGTKATVPPVLYVRDSSGAYELPTASSVTISSSQPLYVALEFSSIAFIPSENGTAQTPTMDTYDKYVSSVIVGKYLAADTASTSAGLFTLPVNVWQGSYDRTFTVNNFIS